jgi:hypothetical protein
MAMTATAAAVATMVPNFVEVNKDSNSNNNNKASTTTTTTRGGC